MVFADLGCEFEISAEKNGAEFGDQLFLVALP